MEVENHIKREFILLSKLKEEAEELQGQYKVLMKSKQSPKKSTIKLKNRNLVDIFKDLHDINQEIKIVIDDLDADTSKFEHNYLISQLVHYNNYGELEVPLFNHKQVPLGLKIYTFLAFGFTTVGLPIVMMNFTIEVLIVFLSMISIIGFGAYVFNLKAKEKNTKIKEYLETLTIEDLYDYVEEKGTLDDIKLLKNHSKNTKEFIGNFIEDLKEYKQYFNESLEIEKDCFNEIQKEKQMKLSSSNKSFKIIS